MRHVLDQVDLRIGERIDDLDAGIPQIRIAERIRELGREILRTMRPSPMAEPLELCVVPILHGAATFCRDLMRGFEEAEAAGIRSINLSIHTVHAASYRDGTAPSQLETDVSSLTAAKIAGRNVLLIDDIFDTGATLDRVSREIRKLGPADLKTVVLLTKERQRAAGITFRPDYCGFRIPDRFVVGYGMDIDGHYRDWPEILPLEAAVRRWGVPPGLTPAVLARAGIVGPEVSAA